MTLLFVYGSLKQGFVNERVNMGARVEGSFRTLQSYPMYLVGDGEVPCIVDDPGVGHQVIGEVYRVTDEDLARMDRLERLGDPGGYLRVTIELQHFDVVPPEALRAFAYVKRCDAVSATDRRIGPLPEYRHEHAANFRWKDAT